MPYIAQELRPELDGPINALAAVLKGKNQGCVNYALSRLLREWNGPSPRYVDYNESFGVLHCVGLELARDLAKYEDAAKVRNGDLPTVTGPCARCGGRGTIPDPDRGSGSGPYWDSPCPCVSA